MKHNNTDTPRNPKFAASMQGYASDWNDMVERIMTRAQVASCQTWLSDAHTVTQISYNTCIFRMSILPLTHYNLLCSIMSLPVSLLTTPLYLFFILPITKSIIVYNIIFFGIMYNVGNVSIYTTFSQTDMWMTSLFFGGCTCDL